MNMRWIRWIGIGAVLMWVYQPAQAQTQNEDVMLVGVSRDDSMFKGGISSSKLTGAGTVALEPIARITASGKWERLPCDSKNTKECAKFGSSYLSKAHTYTVVSADGNGALIHAAPVTLSECYGFDGVGSYTGVRIAGSAISASSPELFSNSTLPMPLDKPSSAPVLKALATLVPKKLDSPSGLRLSSIQLEGQSVIVVQRSFANSSVPSDQNRHGLIFAIGKLEHGSFQLLHWKQNTEDEEERVLGTIQLKNGRAFLITVVSDPESQSFRVYGMINGELKMVWSGGGSSC